MRALVLALLCVGCADAVYDPPRPPEPVPQYQLGDASALPEQEQTPDPCSLRDRIVVDGGFVFDVPLPCTPLPSRDLGDPQP